MASFKIKNIRIPLIVRVVSLYILIGWPLFFWHTSQAAPSPPPPLVVLPGSPLANSRQISGLPIKISIERLGIDLKVDKGFYQPTTDSWTLSDTHAQFATMTAKANNLRGKTLIYGHVTPPVFGDLAKLKVGDIAKVYTDNNHVFSYSFSGDMLVSPSRTDILAADSGAPRLVLMTCNGIWNQERRLMFFNFSGVV